MALISFAQTTASLCFGLIFGKLNQGNSSLLSFQKYTSLSFLSILDFFSFLIRLNTRKFGWHNLEVDTA